MDDDSEMEMLYYTDRIQKIMKKYFLFQIITIDCLNLLQIFSLIDLVQSELMILVEKNE